MTCGFAMSIIDGGRSTESNRLLLLNAFGSAYSTALADIRLGEKYVVFKFKNVVIATK